MYMYTVRVMTSYKHDLVCLQVRTCGRASLTLSDFPQMAQAYEIVIGRGDGRNETIIRRSVGGVSACADRESFMSDDCY